jgi:hypothetical protein
MTPQEASKKMKEFLDSLMHRTSDKHSLLLIGKIMACREIINGKLRIAGYKRTPPGLRKGMPKALKQLINALDKVFAEHKEVGDTDVREQMYYAVHKGFIAPRHGYALPAKFGMFSDEGDKKVRAALQKFLAHPEVAAASRSLKTPEARLAVFQNTDVESSAGNTYDEYFGDSAKQ